MLFTRCPECETTFRITADALRKADGQVRCGRCTKVFNAYNELRRKARKKARAKAAKGVTPEKAAPAGAAASAEHGSSGAAAKPAETGDRAAAPTAPTDGAAVLPATKTPDVEAMPDVAPAAETAAVTGADAANAAMGEAATGAGATPGADAATGAHVTTGDNAQKDIAVGDISLSGVIADLAAAAEADPADPAKPAAPDADVSTITLLEKNGLGTGNDASRSGTVDGLQPTSKDTHAAAPAWVILDEAQPAPRSARLWMAGAIAAAALLAAQVVHSHRNDLAVLAVVGPVVQKTYALLGSEIAPDWNLEQYEIVVDWDSVAQPGMDGDGNLKIAARIRNKGPRPLPLPHVQVQLKDRWESTIGSRVFAPAEYLPRGAALHRRIGTGQVMLATLDIFDPGPQAYGFELDVCVNADLGTLRCAGDEVFR